MPVGRWLVVAVSVALLPAGCSKPAASATASGGGATGPVAVKVAKPVRQVLHWSVEQPGTLSAFEVTPVAAKLAGYVSRIAPDLDAREKGRADAVIDIGSVVRKRQPLATLDVRELVEEVKQKRAAVEQATAEWEQVKKGVTVAEKQVVAAEAMVAVAKAGETKAGADVDRWTTELAQADDLVARKVSDAQSRAVTFKQARAAEAAKAEATAQVASAEAALGGWKARLDRATADVAVAAAKVKVARAAVREAEARAAYLVVRAPFDGVVTERRVHTGHFVQPPAGGQGHPLFVVARLDVVRVFVDVPEASAAKAAPGAKAVVRVPALGNEEFAGTITRTAGVVQPETRTIRTEIDLPNDRRVLQPGMYAFARIEAEAADATLVPAACVLPADETHYVYVVEGDKAAKYRVRLGRADGTNVQVLGRRRATATAGDWVPFADADRVVVGNLGALTDGAAVEVK